MENLRRINVRLSADELEQVQQAAGLWDVPTSWFVREAALYGAQIPCALRLYQHLRLKEQLVRQGSSLEDQTLLPSRLTQASVEEAGRAATKGIIVPGTQKILAARLQRGFPTGNAPDLGEEVLPDLARGSGRTATAYLKASFPSFWQAGEGPATWLAEDRRWAKSILGACGLQHARQAVRDLTWEGLRRELCFRKNTVSFFKPLAARQIYQKWLGDAAAPRVWDPSCGFGARLLGFFSAYPGGVYCGNEPASATRRDLKQLARELGAKDRVEIRAGGSETSDVPRGPFDMVFTSPPYFDAEVYFNEPTQSCIRFPSLRDWLTHFLEPTLTSAASALRPGGHLVLNLSWDLADSARSLCQSLPLALVSEDELRVPPHPFTPDKRPNEPILTWRKTDA